MTTATAETRRPTVGRRVSAALYRRPRLRLTGLLVAPLFWLFLVYFASLFALLATAFLSVNEFTNEVVRQFTMSNVQDVFGDPTYWKATGRTVGIAASVTIVDVAFAVPMAYFMAKVVRSGRWRSLLVALVVTPLWASYLVKVYAWQTMVQPDTGVLAWALKPLGLNGPGYGMIAIILTLAYLWLPYMILPIYAGFERMPDALLDASGDLGGRPWRTFRSVTLPIIYPSIVAGSIFTFSLSMGDYITATIVGGKVQMLGKIVYENYSANLPFAAAVALIPVIVMLIYLALVRRTGALENL